MNTYPHHCSKQSWLLLLGRALICLLLGIARIQAEEPVSSELPTVKHQITGLFMPDREQDLREAFEKLPQFELVSIDYARAEVDLRYDPNQVWPGEKPEKYVERLNNDLRNVSRGTFGAKPLRTKPLEKLQQIEIPVVGLDCKGCSFAAYEMVFRLPGVENATASFKAGKVTALIDPEQIHQTKLEEVLKQGGVELKIVDK